jgi:hypothetical protein
VRIVDVETVRVLPGGVDGGLEAAESRPATGPDRDPAS